MASLSSTCLFALAVLVEELRGPSSEARPRLSRFTGGLTTGYEVAFGPASVYLARRPSALVSSSEMSNPSISSSPWMRGAPQVGFSTTMRKINSRTSFGVGLRPTGPRTREISLQYMRKPARCQPTTVPGVTTMIDCFHWDHRRLTATRKSLSNRLRAGRGRRRFSTVNCCRNHFKT